MIKIITRFSLILALTLSTLISVAMEAKAKVNKRFNLVIDDSAKLKKVNLKKTYDKKLKRERFFKNRFLVKFKANTPEETVKAYFAKNNLVPIKKLLKKTYSCKFINEESSESEILGFVDDQDEVKLTTEDYGVEDLDIDEYREIQVDVVRYKKNYGNGYSKKFLVGQQWYLKKASGIAAVPGFDINVSEAWKFSRGTGIKVAVIDTGFDLDHPDINFAGTGFDVINNVASAQAPERSKENHGTAVSGIIAAKDNTFGVVGVAPDSQIIPIRLITEEGMVSISDIVDAHQKAIELGATIINNSWGSYDPTTPDGYKTPLTSVEEQLYKELAEEVNDGKGVVVIFAAGNSGESNFNRSPEARNEYNLAVGAIDTKGKRADYSVYGDELDIVAPGGDLTSGIVTTDRRDLKVKDLIANKSKLYVLGYDRGDYAMNFKGTSASAPVVAGVAALVWSAKSSLTATQVKQIIKETASKNLGISYQFNSGFNNELGAGLVDAGAAVTRALNY